MIGLGLSIACRGHSVFGRALSAYFDTFGASNVLSCGFGDDWIGDGSALGQSLSSRVGIAAATPSGAGRATIASTLGRGSAVFSLSGAAQPYNAATGAKTQIVIARYDASPTLGAYSGLVANPDGAGPSMIKRSGTAALILSTETSYVDGIAANAIDNSAHVYAVTNATASATTPCRLGNYNAVAGYNWVGPVWHFAQLSVTATPSQLATLQLALKQLYPFLP